MLESVLENIQFALGEPVTLGFLPSFTHGDNTDGCDATAPYVDSDSRQQSEDGATRSGPGGSVLGQECDAWNLRYMSELGADGGGQSDIFVREPRRRMEVISMLTAETEKLHRDASTILGEFSSCTHMSIITSSFPWSICRKKLDKCGKQLTEENATASVLIH